MNKTVNYIVTTRGFTGEKVTECETEAEAWFAIGNCSFGALYTVTSPTNLCVDQFVPF